MGRTSRWVCYPIIFCLVFQFSGLPSALAQTAPLVAASIMGDDPCQLSQVPIRGKTEYIALLNLLELEHQHLNVALMQLTRLTATPGTLDVGDAPPLETVSKYKRVERCLEEFHLNTERALESAPRSFSKSDDTLAAQFMMISGYFTRLMQMIQIRIQLRSLLKHEMEVGKLASAQAQSAISSLSVADSWRNQWDLNIPSAVLEQMTGFHDTQRVFGNQEQLKAIVSGKNQSIRIDSTSLDEAVQLRGKVRLELSPAWVSKVEKSEPTYYLSERTFIQTAKLVLAQALLEQQAEITLLRRDNSGKMLRLPPEIIRDIPTLSEAQDLNEEIEKSSLEPILRDGLIDEFDFTPLVTQKPAPKFNDLTEKDQAQLEERHKKHEATHIDFVSDGFILGLIKNILPEYYKDMDVAQISVEIAKPESAQFAEWLNRQLRFLRNEEHLGLPKQLTQLIRTYPLPLIQMKESSREEELRKFLAIAKLKAITPIINTMIDESNKSRQGSAPKPPPVPKEIFAKVDDYLNWYTRDWAKKIPTSFLMNWDRSASARVTSKTAQTQNGITSAKNAVRDSLIEELIDSSLTLERELNSDPGQLPLSLESLQKALQDHILSQKFETLTLNYLNIIWSQASYSLAADAFKAALGLLKRNQSPDVEKFSNLGNLLGWNKNWSAGATPALKDIPLNQNRGILSVFGQKGGLTGSYFDAYRSKALATPLLTAPVGTGGAPLYQSIAYLKKNHREESIPEYVEKALTYLLNKSQKDIDQVAKVQKVQDLEVVLTKSPLFHRAMNEVYPMFQEYVALLAHEEKYRPALEQMRRPFWEKWAEQNFYPGMLFLGSMAVRGLMAGTGWALRPLKFIPKVPQASSALRAGAQAIGQFERAFLPFTTGYQWAMMVPMGFQMSASWKQIGEKREQFKTVEDFFYSGASSGGLFDYLELMEAEGEVASKQWAFGTQAALVGAFFGIPLFSQSAKRIVGRIQDRRLEQAMETIGASEARISLRDPDGIQARVNQRLAQIDESPNLTENQRLQKKGEVARANKTLISASKRMRRIENSLKRRYELQMKVLGIDSLELGKARDQADNLIQEASKVLDDSSATPQQRSAARKKQEAVQNAYSDIALGAQVFLSATNPGLFETTIYKIKQWRGKGGSLYEPSWTRWERYFETFSPPMDKRGMGFGASADDVEHLRVEDYLVEGKSPYSVLEISPGSTQDDIKTSYRRLARKWHPDVNPNDPNATQEFQRIGEAYSILSDPLRKTDLDKLIRKKKI